MTTDVARRVLEHNESPKGARYTHTRRPVALMYQEACENRSAALKREAAIKALPRVQKLALAGGKR